MTVFFLYLSDINDRNGFLREKRDKMVGTFHFYTNIYQITGN